VPLLLDRGSVTLGPVGAVIDRAALGVRPDGHLVVAHGTLSSDAPLATALQSAGCTRAVLLNRGPRAEAPFRRAGTPSAPRATDDATTLFALAAPMKPRAFRFEPADVAAPPAPSGGERGRGSR
jgi:hypothetical protein